ncbi:MAG: outer membrane protein assembly factor BamA [Acidobacteriota bacterium]
MLLCSILVMSLLAPQAIQEIRIAGNQRVPVSTVHFYIESQAGEPYDAEQLQRDYNRLLETRLFKDVTLKAEEGSTGMIVTFEVTEYPLISAVSFQGAESFDESEVVDRFGEMRVNLRVNSPFYESEIPKALQAIRLLLQEKGRPLGRASVEVRPVTSNAVRLIFTIEEGPKVRIGRIDFEGNTVFQDDELRDALELTKERGLGSVFRGLDKYIEEKLEYDIQTNLLTEYRRAGYIFARAEDPSIEIVQGPRGWLPGFRKTFFQYYITIPVQEGERFRYEGFSIEGVEEFETEQVQEIYSIQPGEVVNYVALSEANESLKNMYSRLGYLEMQLIPEITPDYSENTIDVKIRVEEGGRYIVDRIDFDGNLKTRDKVLRRELLIEEADLFNSELLDRSILRLNQLGFFEEVDYEVIKTPEFNEAHIQVSVKERDQQSINLTGGLGGISGSYIGLDYQNNNFRGLGQRIEAQVLTGNRTSSYVFAFTDPYWLDTRLSAGFRLYHRRLRFDALGVFRDFGEENESDSLFTRISSGFQVSTSHPLASFTRTGLSYTLESNRVEDISEAFVPFALSQLALLAPGGGIEALEGITRSELRPSFVYNTKNRFFGATEGNYFLAQTALAGGALGGRINLISPELEFQKFIPDAFLTDGRNTLAFRTQFQHVLPFGEFPDGELKGIPFIDRIYLGGEFNLRGFDLRSVSPLAITRLGQGEGLIETPIGVGGDTSFVFTSEYRIPLVGPLQLNAFMDLGTTAVWRKDDFVLPGSETSIDLLGQTNGVWRMSTGAEIQFLLPLINQPFRFILAYNPLILDTEVVLNGEPRRIREPRTNLKFTIGYTF